VSVTVGVPVAVAVEVGVASRVDVAAGGVSVLAGAAVAEAGMEVEVSITAGRLGVGWAGSALGNPQAVCTRIKINITNNVFLISKSLLLGSS
jgi:hypothetical protein